MTGFTRQPARRTVPGYVNVLGEATNTASVSVNTNLAYRKDRYFRAELSVDNTANPVWLGITNLAVLSVGGGNYVVSNVTGNVFVPKTPEAFAYDADGNLTSDSLWTNQWNGENRRTVIESRAGVPAAARRREQWTHLPDGRWIERIVSTNNGTAYYPAFTNRYVWDGQVLLAVLDHANNVVLSFLRGLDLSGSQAGAGGVGGVLAVQVGPAVPSGPLADTTHFAAYDGNGNVAALVSATDGSESARYEYGPFGEPLRMTGPMAKANPIRFSTQYGDDVTGDVKYLFRDYAPSTGRWLSRDPIGAISGENSHAFLKGDTVDRVDYLGLLDIRATSEGFQVTVWGITKTIAPSGGSVAFNKTIWQSDASVPFVFGYAISAEATIHLGLLPILPRDCQVKYTPVKINPNFTVHLWPPPIRIGFTVAASAGNTAKTDLSVVETISFPFNSVSYAACLEGRARTWVAGTCGLCLEITSKVKASASFQYNYVLVAAAALAVATAPGYFLADALPYAVGL